MSNGYNVDDILSEIKSKKSRQSRDGARPAPRETSRSSWDEASFASRPSSWDTHREAPHGPSRSLGQDGSPEKLHPRSDFQIDRREQFAQPSAPSQAAPSQAAPSRPASPWDAPASSWNTPEPQPAQPSYHPAGDASPSFGQDTSFRPDFGQAAPQADRFAAYQQPEPSAPTAQPGFSRFQQQAEPTASPSASAASGRPNFDAIFGNAASQAERPSFGGGQETRFASGPAAAPSSAPNPDYRKYFGENAGSFGSHPSPSASQAAPSQAKPDFGATTTFSVPEGGAFSPSGDPAGQASSFDKASRTEHFRIDLPDELMEDDGVAGGPEPSEEEPQEKRGLFHRKKHTFEPEEAEDDNSSLSHADIPVPEDDEELIDYSSPEDKQAIINDMKSIKLGLIIRGALCIVLFFLSLYLCLAARNIAIGGELLPLPTFMQPESGPTAVRYYMIVSTVVCALGAVICSNTVGGGILSLFKFQADTDSLPALAMLGALAQGICYIVRPSFFHSDNLDSNFFLFFPAAILILLFNLIGKLMVVLRIQNNFKLIVSDRVKNSVNFLRDRDLLRDLSKSLPLDEFTIAYPEQSKLLANFLDNSYSTDHAESASRVLAPVSLLAAILLAVLGFFFNDKDASAAISTFAAVLCICAPLTSTIAANLPLLRLSKKLIPAGAMVSGYSAVETFSRTEAIVLDACDLFRPENVVLHGIKAFDQGKIDTVILDAASVVCGSNGMLSAVFAKIIGSNKSMLKPVENLTYEDGMGLSAWVDGKRVLIGNRDLMLNHGVEVPSKDYEMRYVKDSKNIIYLSNSGELSAMFVISYNPNSAMADELNKLMDHGMFLVVETSDPNITEEKICAAYKFPADQLKLLPARFHSLYRDLTAEKPRASSKIGYVGGSRTMIRAILDCSVIKRCISQAVTVQIIALLLGYALVALFTLMGNLSMISIAHVLLYQLLWGALVMILPNMKRL